MQKTVQTMWALGLLGAIVVVATSRWAGGPKLLLAYCGVTLVAAAVFRLAEIERLGERFVGCFGVYAIAGLAHYASILIVKSPQVGFAGHLWRVAFLLGIGVVINLLVAIAITPRQRISAIAHT